MTFLKPHPDDSRERRARPIACCDEGDHVSLWEPDMMVRCIKTVERRGHGA